MANSIWCDDVEVPAIEKSNRVSYKFISGKNENGYEWSMVTSFLSTGTQEDVQRAVDSLLAQSDDEHHVFIEGFDYDTEHGTWDVCLGS